MLCCAVVGMDMVGVWCRVVKMLCVCSWLKVIPLTEIVNGVHENQKVEVCKKIVPLVYNAFVSQVRDQHHLSCPLLLGDQQGAATKPAGRPCLVAQEHGDSSKTDKFVTIFIYHPCPH